MRIEQFTVGSIRIDGVIYEHDVVIARGRVQKRSFGGEQRSCRLLRGHVYVEQNRRTQMVRGLDDGGLARPGARHREDYLEGSLAARTTPISS